MKMLLDTHALLWYVLDDGRMGRAACEAIEAVGSQVLVSPASYWEIAIKISLGKYALKGAYGEFWKRAIGGNGFEILPIDIRHTEKLIEMPYRNHRDPFDRLLVAQVLVEKIALVSADENLDQYEVQRIW
ncbi:MAG: type II toxin-antitoxin system VapC family toxin [Phycisphaerales bacterium]|nr:type II toxin-antitoxin system VapC family toxin [Phycisphaerales bacterium]